MIRALALLLLLTAAGSCLGGRAGPSGFALGTAALARDDGRYTQSPLKPWFDSLRNKNGIGCCSDADGIKLDDPEWRCDRADHCSVKLDGAWREVPPEAILETANVVGYAIVWRVPDGRGGTVIRCFLRGTEV